MGIYKKFVDDLEIQKNNLVTTLNNKGVEATNTETLNTLVPKVNEIKTGSSTKQPLTAEYIKANWIQLSFKNAIGDEYILYNINKSNYIGKTIAYISSKNEGINIGNNVQIIYSALDPNDKAGRYFVYCFNSTNLGYIYIENNDLLWSPMDFDSSVTFFDFIPNNGRDMLLFNSQEADFNGDRITCFYLEP